MNGTKLILFIVAMVGLAGCGHEDKDIHNLQTQVALQQQQLAAQLAKEASDVAQLYGRIARIARQSGQRDAALQAELDALQGQYNSLVSQVAVLQGYKNIVSVINPCGDSAGIIDEVLLRLSDGTLLASFSDNAAGANTRFSIIPAGSYVDTDGSNCHFTVDNAGNVTW